MSGRRGAAIIAVLLLASACGARLTPSQRAAGVGFSGVGGNSGEGLPSGQATVPGGIATGATGLPSGAATSIPGGAVGAPPPAGGNGGATDIGVTKDSITIASVADVSGVQPGLFKSAWQATTALAAFVNNAGGVYGRALKPLLLDSKADDVANKAAVTEACDKAFAMVGSMSAFDGGGAQKGEECGIPDISAITVNASRSLATNVYPAYPVSPNFYAAGKSNWVKKTFAEATQHAAFIMLNAGVSKTNGRQRIDALTKIGFKFVYTAEVQVLEANYTPFVEDMKKKGVEYIGMLADYQSIVRLQKAMKQQSWFPLFRDWDSVAYSSNYLSAGAAVEGSYVFLNTSLFEECLKDCQQTNPEMFEYELWLGRVAPTARPDYFGLYAWSAGRLFVKAITDMGPKLTRKGLLAQLKTIHSWNDFGLHAAHDIGNKRESPCFLYMKVQGGVFKRYYPKSGWDCTSGGLIAAHG